MKFLPSFICLITLAAQAQTYVGARSAGLAHASTTIAEPFSVINNPGNLGLLETGGIAIGYTNQYNVDGWNSNFLAFNTPIANGFMSAAAVKFGDMLMNKTTIHFGYGHKLGIASLGAAVVYNQLYIEGFGSRKFIQVDLGGVMELSPTFSVSTGVKNITQSRVSTATDEFHPTHFYLGFRYAPTSFLNVVGQIDKLLDSTESFKSGLEYQIKVLIFRVGISTNPVYVTAGLGLAYKKLHVDYAVVNNQDLGPSHSVGINYAFTK